MIVEIPRWTNAKMEVSPPPSERQLHLSRDRQERGERTNS